MANELMKIQEKLEAALTPGRLLTDLSEVWLTFGELILLSDLIEGKAVEVSRETSEG